MGFEPYSFDVDDRAGTHANVSRSKIMNIKTIDVFRKLVRLTLNKNRDAFSSAENKLFRRYFISGAFAKEAEAT